VEVEEYARIAAAEDDHWWYRGTRALAQSMLAPWLPHAQRLLDAGCGPGGNGAWLAAYGTLVGVDPADEALRFVRAHRPSTIPVRGDLTRLPLRDASIEVAVALTVLYTIRDDDAALRELARVLAPGGVVLVLEPAFPALRRRHDATVHGRRRYRRAELVRQFGTAGLRVERATYAWSFLAAPAALLAVAERLSAQRGDPASSSGPESDVERTGLDGVFGKLGELERAWLARHDLPVGTSLVVLATRA
jgi:ubiquinone/menaquinone biosynthesis C-methylase UbiE